jgi:acid phosphatase (class A)
MRNFSIKLALIAQLLSPLSFAVAYEVAPPPARGSAADREDFRILHAYQNERTQEQCQAADLQTRPGLNEMFGPSTGVLTALEIKKVSAVCEKLITKAFSVVDPIKDFYRRDRPYNVDSSIRPCIKMPNGSRAYPSAHAAIGILLSAYLATQFPAKRDLILEQGKQAGVNRLIGGVHHPSDVAAGQSLGKQMAKDLAELN